jgi:hypothetical protein
MAVETVTANATRQLLLDRLASMRDDRVRDRGGFERQRVEEEQLTAAQTDGAAVSGTPADRLSTLRSNEGAEAERLRANVTVENPSTERFELERARVDGSQAYAQATQRVQAYQPDEQQAALVQQNRQWLRQAEASRIDSVQLSDQSLAQVQFV